MKIKFLDRDPASGIIPMVGELKEREISFENITDLNLIQKGLDVLKINGRMSVISFHSLEDRIVKRFFKENEKEKKVILINKKVITASNEELKNNPRSRSAKLRILSRR